MLRLGELQRYYREQPLPADRHDAAVALDMRQMAIDLYLKIIPHNSELNLMRYRLRARAASHLVGSLIGALCATSIILIADKFGYLP